MVAVGFRTDRAWRFDVAPGELWAALADTGSYGHGWPWLEGFEGPPLAEGSRTECVIRPPLPYSVRVTLEAVEVVPGSLVVARVSGDLLGDARLGIGPDHGGSVLRLAWDVEVVRPLLRVFDRVARPVLQWGHDWVIDRGVGQFAAAMGLEADEVTPAPPAA